MQLLLLPGGVNLSAQAARDRPHVLVRGQEQVPRHEAMGKTLQPAAKVVD